MGLAVSCDRAENGRLQHGRCDEYQSDGAAVHGCNDADRGSPGSTAGGIKTTTVAVLFLSAIAVFRRKASPHCFGRRIPDETVRNAAVILLTYLTLFVAGSLAIATIEGMPVLTALFETSSAMGTVGMSTGITPELCTASRLIFIALMFFGRVGGLTLMFAALSGSRPDVAKLPQEKITVG